MSRSVVRPLVIVGAVIGVGLITWWGATGLADWVSGFGAADPDTTIVAGEEVEVVVPEGSTARSIATLLEEEGVILAGDFERAVRDRDAAAELQAGRYTLVTGADPDTIIDTLVAGPQIETYRLTIREGLRIGEVLDELADGTPHERDSFEDALLSGAVTSSLLPEGDTTLTSWEGLLFPDTYEYFSDATPVEILELMATTMEQRVASVDWSSLEESGLTVYEGIVAASLIESEAGVDEDRPLIASVIENRLELGMPLQIDATVLYALDRRGGAVTLDDLEVDSPWNTYQNTGLPPTPIGGTGLASLEAAAAPAETDYLYYVLTSEDGSHSFTDDYDEFLAFKAQAQEDGVIP